jgi:L-aspartate oxidase
MPDYTPDADLAPRDVVARSIIYEMQKTGANRVFLDVTHLPRYVITTRFPNIYQFCLEHELDITKNMIPVAPAAHYMMGGVRTNTWGETNIARLFAVGEVACTGVHGANRLASNSMLEVTVFSKRVVEGAENGKGSEQGNNKQFPVIRCSLSRRKKIDKLPALSISAVQQLMWDKVGILRDGKNLAEAADYMAAWQKRVSTPTDRHSHELYNMVLAGRLVIEAALMREESRGAHFRSDFPETKSEWQRHIVFLEQERKYAWYKS